jgi:hypothetical protein
VMFEPGSTTVHQGSLAVALLFFLSAGVYLDLLAPRVAVAAGAIQLLAVFPIFVFGKPLFGNAPGAMMEGSMDAGFAAVTVVSLAGLLLWGARVGYSLPAAARPRTYLDKASRQSGSSLKPPDRSRKLSSTE